MSFRVVEASGDDFDVIEVSEASGLVTRDRPLARNPDEFASMQNYFMIGRGLEKRPGSATFGTLKTGPRVAGLGFHEDDSGITPLAMIDSTLFKHTGADFVASDKTDYIANLDTVIVPFSSKSGGIIVGGTSTGDTTNFKIEDTTKTFVEGEHAGRCVVIKGEIKFIADNDEQNLFLGEKLDDDDAAYQGILYEIFELTPHAIIMNGTDFIQKYDLTTTTALDGTHVTGGRPLLKAKVGAAHQGRMWYAQGTGNQNDRVFLSDTGLAENITKDTNININLQFFNDGDAISNLGPISLEDGSVMVVAKRNSVHIVEGENILNYTSRPVIERDGNIAQKSFATGRGTAWMLGQNGVLSIADAGRPPLSDPLPISLDIQEEIDALSDADKANAAGVVFNNRYYLRIGPRLWYYDIESSLRQNRHIWVDLEYIPYNFSILSVIDNVLYAGDDDAGQVYQIDIGNQDGAENVETFLESAEFSLPGRPHMWIDRVELMTDREDSTVIRFQFAIDGGTLSPVQSQTLNEDNARYVFDVERRCYSFKYQIAETGNNTPSRIIYPIRIFFSRDDSGDDGTKG